MGGVAGSIPYALSAALTAVAARMDAERAASACHRLARAITNPQISGSRLPGFGSVLALLVTRMHPEDLSSAAEEMIKGLETRQEAVQLLIEMGDALTIMVTRLDPKDARITAKGPAPVFAKAMENRKTTNGFDLERLGKVLVAFAAVMAPEDAASAANRLIGTLENPEETDEKRLFCTLEPLRALIAILDPKSAGITAQALTKTMANPKGIEFFSRLIFEQCIGVASEQDGSGGRGERN
jgi:hypothetical protein